MKLNAPTNLVWFIALIVGVVGIILSLADVALAGINGLWLTAAAWLLLVLATLLKGL